VSQNGKTVKNAQKEAEAVNSFFPYQAVKI
jgi:hypothetical protein